MELPALALLAVFFAGGVLSGAAEAFGAKDGWDWGAFRDVFSDPEFWPSLFFTLKFSFLSSAAATALALWCACSLYGSERGARAAERICAVPIAVPHVAAALLAFALLSGSGLPARAARLMGLRLPPLVMDAGGWGVNVAYLWKAFPFTVTALLAVIRTAPVSAFEAARTLGATRRQALLRVVAPRLRRPALACFSMQFAYAFGAFDVPWILGPTAPRALAVKSWNLFTQSNFTGQRQALALACVISCLSVLFCALWQGAEGRRSA